MLQRVEEEAKANNDAAEMAAVQMYKEQLDIVQKESEDRKAEATKLGEDAEQLKGQLKIAEEEVVKLKEDLEKSGASTAELTTRLDEMTKANEEMGEKYLKALEENSEKEAGVLSQLHVAQEEKAKMEEEKTRLENKVEDKRRNEQLINKKLAEMEMTKQEQVSLIRFLSPFL